MAQLETDVEQSSEKRRRWRLITAWSGIIGPILFFVISMIDGFLHPNYSALSEPISNLGAKAPNTWIQNANFFLSGLLLVIFAIGFFWQLRPIVRRWWMIVSTFFLLLTGICLALPSVFPTDIPGYPPATIHGLIHDILFFVVFGTLLIAVLLSGLHLRNIPGWHRYGWYSIIQAIVMGSLFVLLAAVTVSDGGLMGLFQRIFVYEAFSWYVVMGIHFLVLERGRKE
jgi:hypothetical membrane protein